MRVDLIRRDDIDILVDDSLGTSKPTHGNLLMYMKELTNCAQRGHVDVVFFSGHGGVIEVRNLHILNIFYTRTTSYSTQSIELQVFSLSDLRIEFNIETLLLASMSI